MYQPKSYYMERPNEFLPVVLLAGAALAGIASSVSGGNEGPKKPHFQPGHLEEKLNTF